MAQHPHGKTWTERTGTPDARDSQPTDDLERHARAQGYSHTSLGIAGHMVHMGAMLFPVLAAELITDAAQYRKAVRIASITTTALYEGLYTWREAQRRRKQEEKLAECEREEAFERR